MAVNQETNSWSFDEAYAFEYHSKLQNFKNNPSRIVISNQSILRFKYKSLRYELKLQTFEI